MKHFAFYRFFATGLCFLDEGAFDELGEVNSTRLAAMMTCYRDFGPRIT